MSRFHNSQVLYFLLFSILFISPQVISAITLDGILDETEWQQAQHFNQLITVEPYSLLEPTYVSDVLVFSDERGIYFGIKNFQPADTRNNDTSARDMNMTSDKNNIVIDFDGNGHSAYSFEVGSAGSIRDGIWNNENNYSSEWDGNWQAKTSSSNEAWVVEIHIPWDIVSMKNNDQKTRTVKWYFSRSVAHNNQVYANVATVGSRQGFLTDFIPLEILDFVGSSYQVYGYATARQDFLQKQVTSDIGVDLFWKSGAGQQLSLTVNPDFGQIESDNLVVNFAPTEVFFNERRPFFTENQSLFDIRGANGLRLINTRRIGAKPDVGDGVLSDIDGAIKYTNNADNLTYGFFAASESSNDVIDGRDFFSSRFLRRFNDQSIGFLGSFTDRADIDRKALVYSLDHEYRWQNKFELRSQFIMTDIKDQGIKKIGTGGSVRFEHQINENTNQRIELSHYTHDFEVYDFGFLPRNNLNTARYTGSFKNNNFSDNKLTQEREIRIDANIRRNDSGDTLGSYFRFFDSWRYKNSSSLSWYFEYLSSGKDDLFSRGNGILDTDSGYTLSATYFTKNTGKFRNHGFLDYIDTYIGGRGFSAHIHPSYYFTDKYNVSLGIYYTDTNDWLNWKQDNIVGSYHRKQLRNILDFNANFSQKQELRLRFQWIAVSADAKKQLLLNDRGGLSQTDLSEVNDFSISNTALQIRYRYEIAPLSNLYIVYTRGGNAAFEQDTDILNLFDSGIDQVNGDNFLVKVRFKFL